MDGYLLEVISETGGNSLYGTQCAACDSKCKTCVNKADICTSCHDEYKLNGTKCIGLYVVGFRIVISVEFTTFLGNS